jgi:hypothetical protein
MTESITLTVEQLNELRKLIRSDPKAAADAVFRMWMVATGLHRQCLHCGKQFHQRHADHKWCSRLCWQEYYKARRVSKIKEMA